MFLKLLNFYAILFLGVVISVALTPLLILVGTIIIGISGYRKIKRDVQDLHDNAGI